MAGRRAYKYNIVYVRRRYNSITLITYYTPRVWRRQRRNVRARCIFYIIIVIIITMYARARERITGAPTTRVGVYGFHDHDNGLSFGHHHRIEYIRIRPTLQLLQ